VPVFSVELWDCIVQGVSASRNIAQRLPPILLSETSPSASFIHSSAGSRSSHRHMVTTRAPGPKRSSRGKSLMVAERWESVLAKVSRLLVLRMSMKHHELFSFDPNARQAMQDALICKPLLCDSKFSQLVSHHVLCHLHRDVVFSIMDHKPDSMTPQLRRQPRLRQNVSRGRRTLQSSEGLCMTWLGSLSEDCFAALPAGSGTRQSKVLVRVFSYLAWTTVSLREDPVPFHAERPERTTSDGCIKRCLCHVFHPLIRIKD